VIIGVSDHQANPNRCCRTIARSFVSFGRLEGYSGFCGSCDRKGDARGFRIMEEAEQCLIKNTEERIDPFRFCRTNLHRTVTEDSVFVTSCYYKGLVDASTARENE